MTESRKAAPPKRGGDSGMRRRVDPQARCRNCGYYDSRIGCCDYIGFTGRSRGCPPGRACTRYTRQRGRRPYSAFPPQVIRETKPWEQPRQASAVFSRAEAYRLYSAGKNDHEIAKALGVSANAIYTWRKRYELAANGVRGFLPRRGENNRDAAPCQAQNCDAASSQTRENCACASPVSE